MKHDNKVNHTGPPPSRLQASLLRALPALVPPLAVMRARHVRNGQGAELAVEVVTPSKHRRLLYVDVKTASTPGRIPEAVRQLKASSLGRAGYPVFASAFLSARARALCKEAGVGYLDLAGNCYLHWGNFYLEKIVEKNPSPRRGRPPSLFAPVSSRLLRTLLEQPQRAWRISELAAESRVSLGQTSNVCRRLVDEGYGLRIDRRVQIKQPGALLDAWREAATPDRHRYTAYYSFESTPEQLMARVADVGARQGWRYAVTAFGAASLVAPFVHGIGALHWYVADELQAAQWVDALGLRPVASGPNAVVLIPDDPGVFDGARVVQGVTLVGDIQLYLDLAREPARGREQADFLRKQRLTF